MTQPIREYLSQRRSDVQAQIKALRAELLDIDAAERALSPAEVDDAARSRAEIGTVRRTLKEMATEALATDFPEGAEAQTILAWIRTKYGLDVPRESLSPQLSRLGQDGVLAREGFVWRLTQPWLTVAQNEAKKNEASNGYEPSDASSAERLNEPLG